MELSVVLPTHNRAASLRDTLQSFSRLVYPRDLFWELLVVDNNSRDATPEVVKQFAVVANFPVRYLFEATQGRSAALNAGIAQSQGEIIVFTDDDVLLHCDWLSHLKRAFDEYQCAAVAGRVVPQWNHAKPDWLEMNGHFAVTNFDLGEDTKEIRIPPLGANSAFRREMFTKYGVFRLDLGVNGSTHTITCDDTEFGERLIRGGDKIVYCPKAVVYHPVDPNRTTKKYFLSWYYYNGVSLTRTFGVPQEGVFWFGVPRWLYRELLTDFARWMLSLRPKERFQKKLRTYRSIGNIAESYRLSHLKTTNHGWQRPQQS
jgi:GT2 family glycosyltransferase